jgi:predicted MFS family arabinose efflux permease
MAAAFLALPLVRDASSGVLAFGCAGLACSAFFPLSVSLGAPSFRGGAARASSLLTAALMVGVGLGSFVVGPLRTGTSLATFYRYSCAYPLLAWALCAWRMRLQAERPLARQACREVQRQP